MREVGMRVSSCSALLALRIRVSMSAIGSVIVIRRPLLPRALRHTRDRALVGELAQADPAEPELAIDRARPAAPVAPRVLANLELLRPGGLRDQRLLGHSLLLPSIRGEREAEPTEQRAGVLVRARARGDGDVEAADLVDAVVVDLGEDDLLADAERVVPAPVERARAEAAEVTDAGQRDRDQPVEELVHPRAAQRDAHADRHSLADLELRDRPARPAHLRALTGDRRQLVQ